MGEEWVVKISKVLVWCEFLLHVKVVAEDRAKYYSNIDGVTFEESLNSDNIPLFKSDSYEIEDWAKNNMDWEDVANKVIPVNGGDVSKDLYSNEWCNVEFINA